MNKMKLALYCLYQKLLLKIFSRSGWLLSYWHNHDLIFNLFFVKIIYIKSAIRKILFKADPNHINFLKKKENYKTYFFYQVYFNYLYFSFNYYIVISF